MSNEFNTLTLWTNAGIYCRTNFLVNYINNNKFILLSFLYNESNRLSLY